MASTSIVPQLSVRNGVRALAFYDAAFGAAVTYRVQDDSGAIVARLAVNGAEFWVADEAPDFENFSPPALGGSTVRLLLVVDDPDAAFARAVAAGATEVYPPGDHHGWRVGRVRDPFGHHWEIAKPLAEGEHA